MREERPREGVKRSTRGEAARGGLLGVLLVVLALLAGCAGLNGPPTISSPASSVPYPPNVTTITSPAPSPSTEPPSTAAPVTTTTRTLPPRPSTTLKPGKEYEVVPDAGKVVALTFDAAYDPAPLKGILAALEQEDIPATFFLTGEFLRDFPDSVQAIVQGGYPIGNHSYSHPDFTTLSDEQIRSQLSRTASLIEKAGADNPKPLFRPPFGARDKHVLSVLGSEGYVSVYWTIDTLDWETDRTAEQIRNVVLNNLRPGAIILMHVGSKQTAGLLAGLIQEIRARGYGFVDLRSALG